MSEWIGAVLLTCVLGTVCLADENGLVGYWCFDKQGEEAPDLSGAGHTAKVTGGKIVADDGKMVLALDGNGRVVVPSKPDLNLKRGFSVEAMVKPTATPDCWGIVVKDQEYLLRIDWQKEGGRISFFVFLDGKWEPRASAFAPELNRWYHLIAVWDGAYAFLWVNGEPYHTARGGRAPRPTQNPVIIGAAAEQGRGLVGSIEFVKIYNRTLTSAEIVKKTFGIAQDVSARTDCSVFDFAEGQQGWEGRSGALLSAGDSTLIVKTPQARSSAFHTALNVDVDRKDFLSLRMSVDKGSKAELIFATTKGAARVPFQTTADGKPHTYVFEPWTWLGWGGKLLALGIAPAEVENATAEIAYVRVTEQLQAEPCIEVMRAFPDSTLPRAGRPEKIIVRLQNTGGAASNLTVAMAAPDGLAIQGPASQTISSLGFQEQKEVSWITEAAQAVNARLRVNVTGEGVNETYESPPVRFLPAITAAKASYVPEPVPAQTKYNLWTHYCALWKHGTHYGWKPIEPWPERKPVLGWYNEGTPAVADWHIKYWREHGISGVIYCWYRTVLDKPVTVENQHLGHALHDGLLKAKYLPMMKFAIMWENGCAKGVSSEKDLMENVMPFWIENYFTHPQYLRVDGKPLLYVWVVPKLNKDLGGSENVRKALDAMREACKKRGLGGLYIVGCAQSQNKTMLEQMAEEGWDATSAYGNRWTVPKDAKRVGDCDCAPYEGFVEQQEALWRFKRSLGLLPDITVAMMGWDSRPWKSSHFFWSDNTPEKFKDLCMRAKAVMDSSRTSGPQKNTVVFCCWNEFGEGHYIEPTRGNGFTYVDAIRDVFTDAPKEHTDYAPQDVGLGPYDSWYRQACELAPPGAASTDTAWSGEKLGAWQGMMGLGPVEVTGGILRTTSTSNDPALRSPELKLRAARYTKIVVEMRVSKAGGAQIFWTTTGAPRESGLASVRLSAVADGAFHPYTFEVGQSEYWGGCLTSLRFDPSDDEGVAVEIRSIRLE